MRETLAIEPQEWLKSQPIPIQHIFNVLSAFNKGTAKVVRFTGPHTLIRAAGWDSTKSQPASAYGSWWADERVLAEIGRQIQLFKGWLPESQLKKAWPAQYRGATALCEDWNDMGEMYRLNLPSGDAITGLVGAAAPQPQRSTLNPQNRKTPMLMGGIEQVYFKRTWTVNTVNPLWVCPVQLW